MAKIKSRAPYVVRELIKIAMDVMARGADLSVRKSLTSSSGVRIGKEFQSEYHKKYYWHLCPALLQNVLEIFLLRSCR